MDVLSSRSTKSSDYLTQYKNISAKLKKRFLRKPNVAEACEEFCDLERKLTEGEVYPGAALCCIAIARCHHTLSAVTPEIEALVQAGRCYSKAESASEDILCPSVGDHLLTSMSCYQRAVALHTSPEQFLANLSLDEGNTVSEKEDTVPSPEEKNTNIGAAALSLELTKTLEACDHCSESLSLIHSAVNYLSVFPVQHFYALEQLQRVYILLGDFDGALKVSVKMLTGFSTMDDAALSTLPAGIRDIHSKFEVLTVLLLLLLEPLETTVAPVLRPLLSKYTPPNDILMEQTPVTYPFGNHDLFCQLQCLQVAVSTRDIAATESLCVSLTTLLQQFPQDLHLLYLIVTHLQTK